VGKKSTEHLCKIWLEPIVEIGDKGDLTDAQVKEVLKIATDYREKLLRQWEQFKQGKPIRIIKIKKNKIAYVQDRRILERDSSHQAAVVPMQRQVSG
jgi:hypothetical protein